jgi:hypothetical protein
MVVSHRLPAIIRTELEGVSWKVIAGGKHLRLLVGGQVGRDHSVLERRTVANLAARAMRRPAISKRGGVDMKLPDDMKLQDRAAVIEFAAHIFAAIDDNAVVVGPLVWERERADPGRSLFFMVERSEAGRGYTWTILEASREMAPYLRACLIVELGKRCSLTIHDMDDEFAAARLAASL